MTRRMLRQLASGPVQSLAVCFLAATSLQAQKTSVPVAPAVPVSMPARTAESGPSGVLPRNAADDATPDPNENPAVTELALKIYSEIREDKVDRSLFSAEGSSELTPEGLAQNRALFQRLGMPLRLVVERREGNQFQTKYEYLATFQNHQMHLRIVVDTHMKVLRYTISS